MDLRDKETLELMFIDYLDNKLSASESREVEDLISSSEEIESDFFATKKIWLELSSLEISIPTKELKQDFYSMLEEEKAKAKVTEKPTINNFTLKVENLFNALLSSKLIMSGLLLFIGTTFGYLISTQSSFGSKTTADNQVKKLSSEVHEMKEMMMLALLENPLATERMKAVSYTENMVEVDEKVINALLSTFNFDENENVRLVALEALIKMADKPKVREALIEALIIEKSPLVQIALADAMLKLQEKGSIKKLKNRLKENQLNQFVKDKFEKTIKALEV
jgi:hypothetical protein